MQSLVLLCVAAAAIVAFGMSLLTGLGLALFRRSLEARTPRARARVLLGLSVLPMVTTVAMIVAALAPSFGWIADHCGATPTAHVHPHICAHHAGVLPGLSIVALAALFALRWLVTGMRVTRLVASALSARRALTREVTSRRFRGAYVLPLSTPQAFVLGVVRPALFLTQGLLATGRRAHLQTVLAHERAHLRRADPLRRLVAHVAFGFHLPGVARSMERQLARAHEMAADEDAARALGSRARVARALVDLARAGAPLPRAALAFHASDVEARVRALMDTRARADGPRARTLLGLVALMLGAIAFGAGGVHHGLETILGLLG